MKPEVKRHTGSTIQFWLRPDGLRDAGFAHWSGSQAQQAARDPAYIDYRQHFFATEGELAAPHIADVETSIPSAHRIDGIAEVTLTTWRLPAAARALRRTHGATPNAFQHVVLNVTAPRAARSRRPVDRSLVRSRCVLLLRRRPGVQRAEFGILVHDILAALPSQTQGVEEMHRQVFLPAFVPSTDASVVAPENASRVPYHASLVVGARSIDLLTDAIATRLGGLGASLSSLCETIHAYPVADTLICRLDGRPTLPQVKAERKPRLDPVRRSIAPPPPRAQAGVAPASFPPCRLIPTGGHGPGDVVADDTGCLLYGVNDGRILRFDPATGREALIARTAGLPLGLEYLGGNGLLVCDGRRGLLHVDLTTGSVNALVDRLHDAPLRFCSNATAAKDGTIWFTQSTHRFDFEHFVGALLEHRGSGRLMRRSPDGNVQVILDGLHFANGLTLDDEEASVIFAETGAYRISRLWVKGPRQGELEELASDLPGFPDNLSRMRGGRFWVAMNTTRNRTLDRLATSAAWLRKLVWHLPEALSPKPARVAWAMEFDGADRVLTNIHRSLQHFHGATGLVECNSVLYLSSTQQNALLDLDLISDRSKINLGNFSKILPVLPSTWP